MYVLTGIGQLGQPVLPPEVEVSPRFPSPARAVHAVAIFGLAMLAAHILLRNRR